MSRSRASSESETPAERGSSGREAPLRGSAREAEAEA